MNRPLLAGAALVLVANAFALGGAWYNRSGESESQLTLTQRELPRAWEWRSERDNSGVSLRLEWRVLQTENKHEDYYGGGRWGSPAWLDAAKMQSLGMQAPGQGESCRRERNREAYVALEYDGPAWQEQLRRARAWQNKQDRNALEHPGDAKLGALCETARNEVDQEMSRNSRLFAIDAGLDAAALRQAHPDRKSVAIVRAVIAPDCDGGGRIDKLLVDEINVPAQMQSPLAAGKDSWRFVVSYGQRLEPWIAPAP